MKWLIVAIVAEVLAALVLVLAFSIATSTMTCRTSASDSSRLPNPFTERSGSNQGAYPGVTDESCSRRFWWD